MDKPIYILSASHDGSQWGVELDALCANLSGALDVAQVSVVALGANYGIDDTWSVCCNYAQADLDIIEASSTRLSGAYNAGTYAVFADYSVSEIDGAPDDLRGVTIGFSMDFGGKPTTHETTRKRRSHLLVGLLCVAL